MPSFTNYSKVANYYCINYFGQSDEYLVMLRLLKPVLEREFPDLVIYLGCKDDRLHLLENCKHTLKLSELKIRRDDFAQMAELRCNGNTHPIEDFVARSAITNFAITPPTIDKTTRCVIVTKGSHPTKPLEQFKIDKLKRMAAAEMSVEFDSDIKGAGLVMGVESVALCEAAARGIETVLVPTGVGTRLYSKMFPKMRVLEL